MLRHICECFVLCSVFLLEYFYTCFLEKKLKWELQGGLQFNFTVRSCGTNPNSTPNKLPPPTTKEVLWETATTEYAKGVGKRRSTVSGLIPGISILPKMGESILPVLEHFMLGEICTLLILSGAGHSWVSLNLLVLWVWCSCKSKFWLLQLIDFQGPWSLSLAVLWLLTLQSSCHLLLQSVFVWL